MSEKLEQSGAGEPVQGVPSEQTDGLAQRLLSRAANPVGVINTQHPQQMHARTAGWVAQRFTGLEHWRNRYAVEEGSAAAASLSENQLVLPAMSRSVLHEQVPGPTGTPPIARLTAPPSSVLRRSASQPLPPAEPMMRVMRRSVSPAQRPDLPTSSAESRAPGADKVVGNKSASLPPTSSVESMRQVPTSLVFAGTGVEIARMQAGNKVEREESAAGDTVFPTNATSPVVSAITPTIVPTMARRAANPPRETNELATSQINGPHIDRAGVSGATPPLTLAKASVPRGEVTPGPPQGKVSKAPDRGTTIQPLSLPPTPWPQERRSVAAQTEAPVRVTPLPLVARQVQRQAVQEETVVKTPAQRHQARAASSEGPRAPGEKRPVTAEIPVVLSAAAPAKMVWRKGVSQTTTTSTPPLMRSEASRPTAPLPTRQSEGTASQMIEVAPSASAPSTAHGVEVEQLAEQVSRVLARQLQIERERRGMF